MTVWYTMGIPMSDKETTAQQTDWSAIAAGVLFVGLLLWWMLLSSMGDSDAVLAAKGIWGASYQAVALWGGVWGLVIARSWGGTKSIMGRAIVALSAGLLLQVFGQSVFSYYNLFAGVEMPYPSLADVGYFGSIPLYAYGILMLGRASGIRLSWKTIASQAQILIIPAAILGFSYFNFLRGYEFDWTDPLRVFLDFGYPLGQAFYVSIALLTYLMSKSTLGGAMKTKVLFILLALAVQYLADYNFLLQAAAGSWGVSGYGDVIYLSAYFLMALGLIQLKAHLIKTKSAE